MPYKLSERLQQNAQVPTQADLDWGKLGTVFIIFGIISLLTAYLFSWETQTVFKEALTLSQERMDPLEEKQEDTQDMYTALVGPLKIRKYQEVYGIQVYSNLPSNSWSFVEGELLDEEKDYLFSFGKEFWHETGYDSEGTWSEADNKLTMKLTFPQPGQYYLRWKVQGSYPPNNLEVRITRRFGSSLPHFWFGIALLPIGLFFNEMGNRSLQKFLAKLGQGEDDDE